MRSGLAVAAAISDLSRQALTTDLPILDYV